MKYSQQAILLMLLLFSSQMMGQDINISEEMTTVEDSTLTGYRCYQPGCVVPSFPDGTEGLMTWLSENISYPAEAEWDSIQGKVVVSFIIKPDGTPCNPEIISSPHSLLSQEVLRVIGIMPKWNPGSGVDLENIKYKLQLPLTFSLDPQTPIDSCQIDKQSSPSLAQKNIQTFKNVESNIMINKDGSYNAYLFIDTLHFENEGVILSRHDGHYYLFSDSSEIRNVKNYNNIIRENNVYIYQPDFIDYLTKSFNSEYLFNLIQQYLVIISFNRLKINELL